MGNSNDFMDDIYKLLAVDNQKKLIDIVNNRMETFGISAYQMGKMLSISKSTFDRLLKKLESGEIEKVDFYTVLKIAEFLDISVEEISQLYVSSLKSELIADLETSRKANFLFRNFDLKGLKDVGFINDVYDVRAIERKILSFFGIDNLQDYRASVGDVLFSRTKNVSQDKMREFWVRAAHYQFEKVDNSNDYERSKLLALIPKIRPYTRNEESGLRTVIQALYNVGITVIVQKYLSKTQVRGGTFVVNDKPCIVITNYNDSYATLWFALMHEIYHVLNDFEELKTWRYHLTGEPDLNLLKEDIADYFAREIIFPTDKMNYVRHLISSPRLVAEYAKENHVHQSIIYSFYCYERSKEGKNEYAFYSKYFGSPDKALKGVLTNPWNKETIFEEIAEIKKVFERNNN